MLDSIKRLFTRQRIDRDLTALAAWAQRRGHGFRRVRGDDGFVIDGVLDGKPWRMEWGPPQRDYIGGPELRLRMELDLPGSTQMLLLSRALKDSLEHRTFEEFTDPVRTEIAVKAPEEMRWLVMFPQIEPALPVALAAHFGAVASPPGFGAAWIKGALANQLSIAAESWLSLSPPFVLMTLRGRLYLRLRLLAPETAVVAAVLGLFETAAAQAHRTGEAGGPATEWPSTGSSAWQSIRDDASARGGTPPLRTLNRRSPKRNTPPTRR